MQTIKLVPIAMILTLVLGALPAVGDGPGPHRSDAALEGLAFQLARSTQELRREVATSPRLRGPVRLGTLRAVAELDRDAADFRRQVRREGANDRDTRRAFHRLEASFRAASAHLPVVRKRSDVAHELAQVAFWMERVDTQLARAGDRHGPQRYGELGVASPSFRISWNTTR